MRATRRNLQAQPKIQKKMTVTKSRNQKEHFPKKSMFSSLTLLATRRNSPREPEKQ
jgi:hypothetical protein